ncbi:FAR1 DNA binding domain-containing protein [Cynara cardunculus var. scolymus]|uniref:FAR1 DNA binding domain-containing protein n=1 Tax=Cynara cardunculus var. scolymus TaxID=59895 RepID=A0A103Y8J5_CYNCS|nr:FAR1 DNA binding domain-containing protein [Cynara cardunculus var. scolymus]
MSAVMMNRGFDQTDHCFLSISPGGTNWLTLVVDESVKPVIDYVYPSLDIAESKSFDSLNRRKHQREVRNMNIKRTECTACVKFRLMKGTTTYECYDFEEEHNHFLLRHDDIDLTQKGREIKFSDQRFIHDVGISNMGATWAHKLHTSLRGGYEYGGPTVVDFQNYKRDCDNFVSRGDAKVAEVARFNYSEFGNVMSFDATFRTNRLFIT